MSFEQYLQENEAAIREALAAADDSERIRTVLDAQLGRGLIEYNQQEADPLMQQAALSLTCAVRSCLELMDSYGEIRILHSGAAQPEAGGEAAPQAGGGLKQRLFRRIYPVFGVAGIVLLAGAVFFGAAGERTAGAIALAALLCCAGGALLYLAGSRRAASIPVPDAAFRERPRAVPTYDKDRILRQFRRILLTLDRALDEQRAALGSAAALPETDAQAEGAGGDLSDEEDLLLLLSGQLEALYSKDGAYALDELAQVRHFLHRHGISLSDDAAAHREWFEFVPTAQRAVLRPALWQAETGKLLKKGLCGE